MLFLLSTNVWILLTNVVFVNKTWYNILLCAIDVCCCPETTKNTSKSLFLWAIFFHYHDHRYYVTHTHTLTTPYLVIFLVVLLFCHCRPLPLPLTLPLHIHWFCLSNHLDLSIPRCTCCSFSWLVFATFTSFPNFPFRLSTGASQKFDYRETGFFFFL